MASAVVSDNKTGCRTDDWHDILTQVSKWCGNLFFHL